AEASAPAVCCWACCFCKQHRHLSRCLQKQHAQQQTAGADASANNAKDDDVVCRSISTASLLLLQTTSSSFALFAEA
ncbi:hypothetical protein PSY27_23755, partial [Shigella flexneri]|nr:hypothetical protein [Shigella flexneri]